MPTPPSLISQDPSALLGRWLSLLGELNGRTDTAAIAEQACFALAQAPGVLRAELRGATAPLPREAQAITRHFPLRHGGGTGAELRLTLCDPEAFAPFETAAQDFCGLLDLVLAQAATTPAPAAPPSPPQDRDHTLAQILDAVPQPVFWKDSASVYLGCNRLFAHFAGLPAPEAIVGKTDFDMPWAQTEAEAYRADDRAIMAERAGRRIVESQRQADGRQIWIETTKVPLFAADGQVRGVLGVFQDITESRRLAEQLRQAATERSTVLDTVTSGIAFLRNRRLEWANPAFAKMFGYELAEITGMETATFYAHAEDFQRVGAEGYPQLATGGVYSTSVEMRRRDGTTLWCTLTGRAVSPSDVAAGTIWALHDITEQIRTNESIRAASARVESVFRAAPVAIGLIANRCLLETNDATLRLTGYSREELLGKSTRFLYPTEEDFARVGTLYRRLGEDPPPSVATRWMRKDGSIFDILMYAAPLDPADPAKGAMAVAADISELKRAEQQIRQLASELEQRVNDRTEELARRVDDVERLNADLRVSQSTAALAATRLQESNASLQAANQELESFSYSVSHDLRAPLRNIAGFIELLRRRTTGQLDAEAERFFGIVGAEAVRMSALIDDLLAFSRIGRAELHFAPVALAELIAEVKGELSSELVHRTIAWRIGQLPHVHGDRALLRQVVANLLSNAVKFTRRHPAAVIEIGALAPAAEAGDVTFFVRDNGAGFDPKYTDKLFGVFQRLHNPREFEGTGIGLANVKRIVLRHGGRVWAEGAPEAGATFYFTLPRAAASISAVA
ncbi:MAG TPA: PAS domain S-box protein [Opitutaceae bacterium]|nr:PAS domain S-box protein [Opitutaceae bacterium]